MGRRTLIVLMLWLMLGSAAAQSISPTTGMPLEAEPGMPVVVSISHNVYRENGKKAAGAGRGQSWGAHQADIVYESLLHRNGSTRLAFLFHDALVNGEKVEAGPVRSVRTSHVILAQEWNAALVYGAGVGGNAHAALGLRELQSPNCALGESRWHKYGRRIQPQGERRVKAPDNLSADVSGIYTIYKEETHAKSQGLVFSDTVDEGLPGALRIDLDWGMEGYRTRFDFQNGQYMRYVEDLPAMSYRGAEDLQEEQMHFANVVVLLTEYTWHPLHEWMPVLPDEGEGEAWVFRQGRAIQGIWKREGGKTVLLDAEGEPATLCAGKTFFAHFPSDHAGFMWK